jgi:ABC-type multidrug transport system fused ATPase/permease subunit
VIHQNPEGAEFVEPRPAASWPSEGKIVVEDLVIRYAPDLPNVLHKVSVVLENVHSSASKADSPASFSKISFEVEPTWKVGVCGPTGCGSEHFFPCSFKSSPKI